MSSRYGWKHRQFRLLIIFFPHTRGYSLDFYARQHHFPDNWQTKMRSGLMRTIVAELSLAKMIGNGLVPLLARFLTRPTTMLPRTIIIRFFVATRVRISER
ncbi:MAG TPA: hypothetical protein VMZ24_03840 [Patescibacteria group bacterium]|nr:hypothetical protein [Patescibacteria group bacterium]